MSTAITKTINPTQFILQQDNIVDRYASYSYFRGVILKWWQWIDSLKVIYYPEVLWNWGRGMSKTFLLCFLAVFFAILGLRVCYLVPRSDQLVAAQRYFNENQFVDPNPRNIDGFNKTFHQRGTTWYSVRGRLMIKLINIDDHGENISSERFDVVIADEAAQIMNKKNELFIYEKMDGMLRVALYPKMVGASTPLLGSHFVSLIDDMEIYKPECISWRNFINTPDNFISATKRQMTYLMNRKQRAIRMGMLWDWECENLAVPRTPGGHPFPNVVWDTHGFVAPRASGCDYHGPDIGHITVEWWWSDMTPLRVYAVRESAHRYMAEEGETIPVLTRNSLLFMNHPYYKAIPRKKSETFGFNQGYWRQATEFGFTPYQNMRKGSDKNKQSVVYNFLNFEAHINKQLTPLLADDIRKARWDKPGQYKIIKKSEGVQYRNHYIDAGFVALPQVNEGGYIMLDSKEAGEFQNDGAGGLINRQKRAGVYKR